MELSARKWKLGFTVGLGQKPRQRTIDAGDLGALREAIERAYKRFKLPESTQVVRCYEAGRDGFWIHRYLEKVGIRNGDRSGERWTRRHFLTSRRRPCVLISRKL